MFTAKTEVESRECSTLEAWFIIMKEKCTVFIYLFIYLSVSLTNSLFTGLLQEYE